MTPGRSSHASGRRGPRLDPHVVCHHCHLVFCTCHFLDGAGMWSRIPPSWISASDRLQPSSHCQVTNVVVDEPAIHQLIHQSTFDTKLIVCAMWGAELQQVLPEGVVTCMHRICSSGTHSGRRARHSQVQPRPWSTQLTFNRTHSHSTRMPQESGMQWLELVVHTV
jgi:hypothetical protein